MTPALAATATTDDGTPAPDTPVEVLIRAVDAGPTYLYVRWLDQEARAAYRVIDPETIDPLIEELRAGLMTLQTGEGDQDAADRALRAGVFTDPQRTTDLCRRLAEAILPEQFWERLATEAASRPVRARITPSRRLATLPWELLPSPAGVPLLRQATLVYEVPATIHYHRPVLPSPYDPCRRPLRTIDPVLKTDSGLEPTLRQPTHLLHGLGLTTAPGWVTRLDLSQQLRADPGRWLYFGHVSTRHEQPGSAALHLSDGKHMYGTAELMGAGHRPLTALDLHLGTSHVTEPDPDLRYPAEPGVLGWKLWPMPPRVALIACESGSDHAASEPFGLIVAVMLAGAEHVTSTRWAMPTDRAFQSIHHVAAHPTSDLAIAVDRAHTAADPIAALRTWQLEQLQRWLDTANIGSSPLLFAGVTTHHAPARDSESGFPHERTDE